MNQADNYSCIIQFDKVLLCERCDRAMHLDCNLPSPFKVDIHKLCVCMQAFQAPPEGDWFCDVCLKDGFQPVPVKRAASACSSTVAVKHENKNVHTQQSSGSSHTMSADTPNTVIKRTSPMPPLLLKGLLEA
jgi:hypothetical protein